MLSHRITDMMRLHDDIVYGPIRSRRLGNSLGINILPPRVKLCNFNCQYCQYGWSQVPDSAYSLQAWPSVGMIVSDVETRLRLGEHNGEPLDRLTLAGHGEPTLHPRFGEIVAALVELRNTLRPTLPLAVLSNSSTADNARVREELSLLDERYMKLDAGDNTTLRLLNASPVPLESIAEGLRALASFVTQTMFVRDRTGRIDNSTETSVTAWLDVLHAVQPLSVHVYTIDRAPASPFLQPVPVADLEAIAARVRGAGIAAQVFD